MDPVVLVGDYGCSTAFKITTAKVYTLDRFMQTHNRQWVNIYVTTLNDPDAKPRKLTASIIRAEYPQYVGSAYYRSITRAV